MALSWLTATDKGLYCEPGDFYVDPWRSVDRAVITHAHADHARRGHRSVLCSRESETVMRTRLGKNAPLHPVAFGAMQRVGDVHVSLHPAGHILGASQVRMEYRGQIVVVSGDYKTDPDTTCSPFEPIPCHSFVSECTFGLPVYRWPDSRAVVRDLQTWWTENQARQTNSILFVYALGKAQRILADLDPSVGPILCHGAVQRLNDAYRLAGISLPETQYASVEAAKATKGRALILAPPSAQGSTWIRKFKPASTAFASGWMTIRGQRRRRAADRGFVVSDHADWRGLNRAIRATGAEHVLLTHGHTDAMQRHLREQGLQAGVLSTRFRGEQDEDSPEADNA